MPFLLYNIAQLNPGGGAAAATSPTPNQEFIHAAIKPGARDVLIMHLIVGGMIGGATAISGIACRLKRFTTTASILGTSFGIRALDPGQQAAKATATADPCTTTGF